MKVSMHIFRPVLVCMSTFVLFPVHVFSADTVRPVTEAVSVSQVVNLLAGLLLVLMIFFAVVFLLKRLSGLQGMNRGHMKIVDALHLGTKERLLIVKVTDQHLLLGVSPQGIHPLHVITDGTIPESNTDSAEQQPGFHQLLSRFNLKRA